MKTLRKTLPLIIGFGIGQIIMGALGMGNMSLFMGLCVGACVANFYNAERQDEQVKRA